MRVLITGTAGGIGAATARVLHSRGCEAVATARRPELFAEVPALLRLPLDVTSDDSVAACLAEAGEIDVLVNNAAITEAGPLERYRSTGCGRAWRRTRSARCAWCKPSRPRCAHAVKASS